jgi:hypothetical protein
MVVYDWYKEVEDFIGQNTMMVPRFEGYSFDSDGLWNLEVGFMYRQMTSEDVDPEQGS